jgi:hypothetical protein
MSTTTIPAILDIGTLLRAAGSNLADPRVVFEGRVFDGKKEFAKNPMASIDAYSTAIYGDFEQTTLQESFPGTTKDELAVALQAVLKRMEGGKPQAVSNDPSVQPGTRRLEKGYNWDTHQMEYAVVPKGEMSVPDFRDQGSPAKWQPTMQVGVSRDGVPYIYCSLVRGDQDIAQGVFEFVRQWSNEHSIYLGQIINQDGDFVKMTDFKPQNVALTDSHRNALELFVRGPLEHWVANGMLGIPPKSGIFFYGDPGGGKTMIMNLCAYTAARMGAAVTVVHPEAGIEGFKKANEMAIRLMKAGHQCMIQMEDMEKLAKVARATVLDILDGGEAKGLRCIFIGTTNFIDKIDRAMIRPGRFDGVEEAGLPDLPAFTQLLGVILEGRDLSGVNFAEAFKSFDGYTYAFIASAVTNIKRAMVIRAKGDPGDYKITTEDLVSAAMAVRGHFNLLQEPVTVEKPAMDELMRSLVSDEIEDRLDQRHFSDDIDYGYIEEKVAYAVDSTIEGRLDGAEVYDNDRDKTIGTIKTN